MSGSAPRNAEAQAAESVRPSRKAARMAHASGSRRLKKILLSCRWTATQVLAGRGSAGRAAGFAAGIAARALLASPRRAFFLEREGKIIHGIGAIEDGEIRLKRDAQARAAIEHVVLGKRGQRRAVERDDLRPLEAGHFRGERGVAPGHLGVVADELRQAAAEIAQREGGGGKLGEEGGRQFHEPAHAQDGAHAGIIVVKAIENAKPIGAGVNLEALDGGEPVVRLHEIRGHARHRAAVAPARLQSIASRERAEKRPGHDALEFAQVRDGANPTRQQAAPRGRGTAWL